MLTRDEIEANDADQLTGERSSKDGREVWTAQIPMRLAVVVGLALVALNAVVLVLYPAADEPEVAQSWAYAAIDLVFWVTAIAAGIAYARTLGDPASFTMILCIGALCLFLFGSIVYFRLVEAKTEAVEQAARLNGVQSLLTEAALARPAPPAIATGSPGFAGRSSNVKEGSMYFS